LKVPAAAQRARIARSFMVYSTLKPTVKSADSPDENCSHVGGRFRPEMAGFGKPRVMPAITSGYGTGLVRDSGSVSSLNQVCLYFPERLLADWKRAPSLGSRAVEIIEFSESHNKIPDWRVGSLMGPRLTHQRGVSRDRGVKIIDKFEFRTSK
jgi:hypothetical protein